MRESITVADLVLLIHLVFILFVAAGGLAVLKWPRMAWLHLPAAAWGAWIELSGRICPLTPLENRLRLAADQPVYQEGFINHYLSLIVYPPGLTRVHQILMGAAVITVNLIIYAFAIRKLVRRSESNP